MRASRRMLMLAAVIGVSAGSCSSDAATSSPAPLVSHPCRHDDHRYTAAELGSLAPKVEAFVGRNATSAGPGATTIEVGLLPGRERLADRLQDRFGGAVRITVGTAPYDCGIGLSRKCPALAAPSALPAGVSLALQVPRSIGASATTNGTGMVRNDGPNPLAWDTGQPLLARIVKPGTRTVVGTYTGAVAGTGFLVRPKAGETAEISALVAAWRCDGKRGSTLPAGRYGAVVALGPTELSQPYLTPEVPITVR